MSIGPQLRNARTTQQLTQQQVADSLNVTRQTISSWETGHSYPDAGSLIDLSRLYQLSLDTLLNEDADLVTDIHRQSAVLHRIKTVSQLSLVVDLTFLALILGDLLHWPGMAMGEIASWLITALILINLAIMFNISHSERLMRRLPDPPRIIRQTFIIAFLGGVGYAGLFLLIGGPWWLWTIVGCVLLALLVTRLLHGIQQANGQKS
ncbi:helix-turn-helix domain-containing protein [Lacticaseibacillus mingshuiensis]|uniref:Helix-turn-helix domain-containing protein n=1 Tax=Lacticaseibacillus mingshuiensis TaxID=2799574 RepID=A0ABW4CKP0_9LACO|nr:helix-turn-helix transcriptional regulator [Lacticaseibacillus mingshuiensis]